MTDSTSSWERETLKIFQEGELQRKRVNFTLDLCKRWKTATNGNRPTDSEMSEMVYGVAQLPVEKQAVCQQAIIESGFIKRTALEKRLRELGLAKDGKLKVVKPSYCAKFHGLVDLVEDQERIRFLIRTSAGGLELIDSIEQEGKTLIPPKKEHLTYAIPNANNVKTAFSTDEPGRLFNDLFQYHQRISQLPSENHLILLTAWDFSTYRQEVLPYSGYLTFFNVAGRGKTRTGKGLMNVAYRGVHTITIRESNLFRISQDLQASIFLDVMDLSKKLAKNESEDILLQRFERGARIQRTLFPERGPFEDTVSYEIFGPTVIATNIALHKILDTRCFPISMPHSDRYYPAPSPMEGCRLRERLVAWRAKHLFDPLASPGKIMSGRLGDIAMPLRSILQEVKPEAIPSFDELIDQMQTSSREDKAQSLEARLIGTVKTLALANQNCDVPISDIAAKLNQGINEESIAYVNAWKIGRLLKALGFKRGRSSQKRHIEVEKEELESMCLEYGIEGTYENLPETSQASQCHRSTDYPRDISDRLTDSQMSLPDTDGEMTL